MKLLNWITKGSIGMFRVLYLLLAVAIILGAAYVLGGYAFLAKGMWGNDMGSALSMAAWVDKYFPRVPFWYPLAGGGVSITHSYPVFSFYLVALLKRLTSLDLIQAFRVLGISSVPLMALGIYAFVALRFKNQTAAFIASILYLVSPIAWVWLFDWGFYAESVSHIFVTPAVIFWDLFFTSFLDNTERFRNRVYLALTAAFLSLALLTHFATGLGLMALFGFYVIGYTVKAKERKSVFVRGVLALSLIGLLTLGITAFTTLPFYRYTKIAAKAGAGGSHYEGFKQSRLTTSLVLGFRTLTKEDRAARHISFPAVVSFFAFLGVLLSLQRARYLTLALFTIFALSLSFNPDFLFWMSRHIPRPLASAFSKRPALILLRFILPTLAALGAIGIFKIPFFWVRGRFGSFIKGAFASLAGLVLIGFALYWFGHLPRLGWPPFSYGPQGIDLRNVWGASKGFCFLGDSGEACFEFKIDGCLVESRCFGDEECLEAFGSSGKEEWCHSPLVPYFLPLGVQAWCGQAEKRGLTLPKLCYPGQLTDAQARSFWQKCQENESFSRLCSLRFESLEEQLSPTGWPRFETAKILYDPVGKLEQLEQTLSKISAENPLARLDFSTYLGQFGMWTPYYNRGRNLSQIHIYASSSTLIRQFWGQQISAFYHNNPFYGEDPNFINNVARWFGINYVFFSERTDPRSFREGGWKLWNGGWNSGVLKFPEENSLADLTMKPTVLVIGPIHKVGAYNQVFHLSAFGVLPYEDALLVWGTGAVDDYSLKELENFDVLLLHGYTYRNREQADQLLKDYVVGGGKVFIDTGWQYTTPDWETAADLETMGILPFRKLFWKDLGKTSDFVLEDSKISSGIDVSQFAPLIYQDQPWGVSTSEKSDLRDWARAVLSVKGYPLIVTGELGAGRIVWSGMNILPHVKQGEKIYYEEIELLANLFSWLTEGISKDSFLATYKREHPDRVEFTVEEDVPNGGFLFWKEAYHPDFHATLISNLEPKTQNLNIYRAGPSFVSIKVPKVEMGDKIVYEYKVPLSEKASSVMSLLTLFFLPAIVIEGPLLREKSIFLRLIQAVEGKLHHLFFELWRKPFGWWEKGEEEGY